MTCQLFIPPPCAQGTVKESSLILFLKFGIQSLLVVELREWSSLKIKILEMELVEPNVILF